MKKCIILAMAIALAACGAEKKSEIIIDEQNHQNAAYDLSYELASAVKEATTYEEFRSAADNLKAYQEADCIVACLGHNNLTEKENHDRTFELPDGQICVPKRSLEEITIKVD